MFDGQTVTADGLPIVAQTNGHSAPEPAPIVAPAPVITSNVIVRVKPPQPVEIDVDFDRLRGDHLALVQKMQGSTGDEQYKIMLKILEIVTGGQDMSDAPLRVTSAFLAELAKYIGGADTPN
mgnify:CR=1 FL=1